MKKWPGAGVIPVESRTVIDKIEYWLFKHGIGTMRGFAKWNATLLDEELSKIDINADQIEIKETGNAVSDFLVRKYVNSWYKENEDKVK